MIKKIPAQVIDVLKALNMADFEAYIVGGCVRDLIMDKIPKDWDVTTNAKPENILEIFPDSFYENTFGTVGVKVEKFAPNSNPEREPASTRLDSTRLVVGMTKHYHFLKLTISLEIKV